MAMTIAHVYTFLLEAVVGAASFAMLWLSFGYATAIGDTMNCHPVA
jgi:hypothetical protein